MVFDTPFGGGRHHRDPPNAYMKIRNDTRETWVIKLTFSLEVTNLAAQAVAFVCTAGVSAAGLPAVYALGSAAFGSWCANTAAGALADVHVLNPGEEVVWAKGAGVGAITIPYACHCAYFERDGRHIVAWELKMSPICCSKERVGSSGWHCINWWYERDGASPKRKPLPALPEPAPARSVPAPVHRISSQRCTVRSFHGTYLRTNDSWVDVSPVTGPWEQWFLQTMSDGSKRLRNTRTKRYLCGDARREHMAVSTQTPAQDWELWDVIQAKRGRHVYHIQRRGTNCRMRAWPRTDFRNRLSGGRVDLTTNRDDWEEWTFQFL
ncbi:hypothetical protein JKP88DRAFT_255647 [Tribonema minus]|uniref:Uncharacterized protein n=1 Tax=Tribonema minus TaxID=303371 RepID=A0A835Z7U1_9STRA|nr:hypothetical protein JKP88DRAFT_255647 [Tribonema minus]